MKTTRLWSVLGGLVLAFWLVACGESGQEVFDAGTDAGTDAGIDAGVDAGVDGGSDPIDWVNPGCAAGENVVVDGLRLDVEIDLLDYQQGVYAIREKITVRASEAGTALSFFGEQFEMGWASAGYAYDDHLATFCTGAFAAGEEVSVEVEFVIRETDTGPNSYWGLRRWDDGENLVIGPFNEPYFAPFWLLVPQSINSVNQHYDDSPALHAVDIAIVTPDANWTVIGPGGPVEPVGADRPSWNFSLHEVMPLYSLSFAASTDYQTFSVGMSQSGVEVIGAVPADLRANAEEIFPAAIVTIDWMEEHFGSYSFGDVLSLVGIPNFGGGMEHTSVIWLGNGTIMPDARGEFIVVHETVHMWWGNTVRFADWPHFWLAEGFDEWSTNFNILGELLTPANFAALKLRYRIDGADLTYSQIAGLPAPGPLRFGDDESMVNHFISDLQLYYVYGAAFLEMVNQRLIRDFDTDLLVVLKAWYQAKKFQAVTTEDFLAFLIDITNDENYWTALFADWVYQTPVPTLTVSAYDYSPPTLSFTLARTAGADQNLDSLDIVMVGLDQDVTTTVSLPSGTDQVQVTATVSAAPERIAFDPKQFYVFRLKEKSWSGPDIGFTVR